MNRRSHYGCTIPRITERINRNRAASEFRYQLDEWSAEVGADTTLNKVLQVFCIC